MSSCCVSGCKSSWSKNVKKKEIHERCHLFKAKTIEASQQWRNVIPNGDKLKQQFFVCHLHFDVNDIVTEDVTKLVDGTEFRSKRIRPLLKDGAIPKHFPQFSEPIVKREKIVPPPVAHVTVDEVFLNEKLFSKIYNGAKKIPLPSPYWFVTQMKDYLLINKWMENLNQSAARIILDKNKDVKIFFEEKELYFPGINHTETVSDLSFLIKKLDELLPCIKCTRPRAENCIGFVKQKKPGTSGQQAKYCLECKNFWNRNRSRKDLSEKNKSLKVKNVTLKNNLKIKIETNKRLARKGKKMKDRLELLQKKCSEVAEDSLVKAMENLSANEQLAVRACVDASRVKGPRGMRYCRQWIYECILLRIKSKKGYKHLRKKKVLALPSFQTLDRCMKRMKSAYGFQDNVFETLKLKTAAMDPKDRHGAILIDEMKLSTALTYNPVNLTFEGFTNLGDYTPEHKKSQLADHALVFMFQSFMTGQVQTLGCFLSKGSASSTVLHKLLIDCILLSENAGLLIDVVTSDGAAWNRSMWDKFGVTEEVVSIVHIVDKKRRIWFISDFPHLIKCLRNFLISLGIRDGILTPDGIISLLVWIALLESESTTSYNVKVNFKLRIDHIQPKYFQKMNVALAFQFFGIAEILELYRDRHPELENSVNVQKFCSRVKGVINAMNCRTPLTAMAPGNEPFKKVQDFIVYLKEWKKLTDESGRKFITESTYYGLLVSLQATLQLCEYLVNDCGFTYLMTSRLNQDALERFFGMMRESCGANDHPDSNLFIQMYRLISTYSISRPPKGSNISSSEILDVLLKIDSIEDINERKEQWQNKLDTILDRGNFEVLPQVELIEKEHDYSFSDSSQYAIAYMAGYVARKAITRFCKYVEEKKQYICKDCESSLVLKKTESIPESHKFIELKTQGFLKHPSSKLTFVITSIEEAIMSVVKDQMPQKNTLFEITELLEKKGPIAHVGCRKHELLLTRRIMSFYLTTRMYFLAKQTNLNNLERKQSKEKRKAAKLISTRSDVSKEPTAQMKKKLQKRM